MAIDAPSREHAIAREAPGWIVNIASIGVFFYSGAITGPLYTVSKSAMVRRTEVLDSTLLFLVSPSSRFVTGTVIKADDGQLPR